MDPQETLIFAVYKAEVGVAETEAFEVYYVHVCLQLFRVDFRTTGPHRRCEEQWDNTVALLCSLCDRIELFQNG